MPNPADVVTPAGRPSLITDSPNGTDTGELRAGSGFSRALARVEAHRKTVRITLGIALVARLLFEFQFVSLLRNSRNLLVQVPYIGFAVLGYLVVLMWLAARTRDRFGFGMALGIGVIEATYRIVTVAMLHPITVAAAWPAVVVALAHVPMAIAAFRASTAYPPLDSKRPWIVGFVTALFFLAIPWLAPSAIDYFKL